MQKATFRGGTLLALSLGLANCTNPHSNDPLSNRELGAAPTSDSLKPPAAHSFVSTPLRNRIQLELNAPLAEVWSLVGDPGRMPEYSEGLQRVETQKGGNGQYRAYTCYFKPLQEGDPQMVHHARMMWYAPDRGWASVDEEPNPSGLQQSLALVTCEARDHKTILDWRMHFNAASDGAVKMNVASLEQALNQDIAQKLIQKFGGRVLVSYVQGK